MCRILYFDFTYLLQNFAIAVEAGVVQIPVPYEMSHYMFNVLKRCKSKKQQLMNVKIQKVQNGRKCVFSINKY